MLDETGHVGLVVASEEQPLPLAGRFGDPRHRRALLHGRTGRNGLLQHPGPGAVPGQPGLLLQWNLRGVRIRWPAVLPRVHLLRQRDVQHVEQPVRVRQLWLQVLRRQSLLVSVPPLLGRRLHMSVPPDVGRRGLSGVASQLSAGSTVAIGKSMANESAATAKSTRSGDMSGKSVGSVQPARSSAGLAFPRALGT